MQFDENIVEEFVAEAKEHMASIEGDLLAMEKMAGEEMNKDLVNRVFRAIHTVKGSAGFLGFIKLADLAHVMETLLSLVRSGEITVDSEVVEPLFKGVDAINAMMSDIQASNAMEITGLVSRIEKLTKRAAGPAAEAIAGESAPEASIQARDNALESLLAGAGKKKEKKERRESPVAVATLEDGGYQLPEMILKEAPESLKHIYLLRYDLTRLASAAGKTPVALMKELNEAGKILDTNIKFTVEDLREGLPKKPLYCDVVYATSIEKDLIKGVTGLAETEIVELDVKKPKAHMAPPAPAADETAHEPEEGQDDESPDEMEEETGVDISIVGKMEAVKEEPAPRALAESAAREEPEDRIFGVTKTVKDAGETIRLNVSVIDKLMTLAGELVLVRNQYIRSVDKSDPISRAISQRLDVVTTEIQESIMSTRMQPIGNIFNKFPRVIREMNRQLGKNIEMDIQGAEVELDKTILEALADPLTHLVRNSCGHGIESPAERAQKGKPETGHIHLRAYHEGGQINIVIKDDGRGINLDKVKNKAIERGIKTADELAQMTEKEILFLTVGAGFSTAEKVTGMSGRGVGLDVVRTSVEDLGGVFDIDSTEGEGTTMRLRLPLTLAIIPCLIVQMADYRYAIPQVNVEELVCLYDEDVKTKMEIAGDREVYRLRNRLLSMVRLSKILDDGLRHHAAEDENDAAASRGPESKSQSLNFGVLKAGANRFGLIIDKIIGTEEIVVKPMHPSVKEIGCYAGATVMGDGKVALILDAQGLARAAGISTEGKAEEDKEDAAAEADTHTTLLFEYGPEEQFALALSLIKRIERIKMASVEKLGGERYITIDGVSTQLLTPSRLLTASGCEEGEEMFLLLPKHVGRPVGIVINKLLDIEEAPSKLNDESYMEDGLLGTAIIRGRLTLFPDVFRMVDMSENKWLLEERLRKEAMAKGSSLPRVLAVVDDPYMKILVRRYLHSEGYEVGMAAGAEEALKRIKDENFDAMVCDVASLGKAGLDLIQAVRAGDRLADIPAVALVSAERMERERAAAEQAGYTRAEVKLEKDKFLLTMAEVMNRAMTGQGAQGGANE